MQATNYKRWVRTHPDTLFDLVRIYLGIGLFVKAVFFISHPDYLIGLLEKAGPSWFAPTAIQHYAVLAHLVGGLLLAAGMLTRLAALAQIPLLVGAILYVHLPQMLLIEPRQNFEFSALVLFLLVLLAIFGGGRLSADYYLFSRKP